MKNAAASLATAMVLGICAPARAADGLSVERLAICADSWMDWSRSDPARLQKYGADFRAAFSPSADGTYFVPRHPTSALGFRVVQVLPQSVGMGVGFSLTVEAPFDAARRALEKALGQPLKTCDTSDDMRSCELEIGDNRTAVLMAADDAKSTRTLLGCYYYYEK